MLIPDLIKLQIKTAALGTDKEICGVVIDGNVIVLNNIHANILMHF